MKAAFTVWNNRIAPVFDVARQIRVVGAEGGRVIREDEVVLKEDTAAGKAGELSGLGVNALVCGAISRTMANLVSACGIQVIPFVAGDLREVIDAWIRGGITDGLFLMPGCRGRRRLRGWGAFEKEGNVMKGRKQGGGGRGRGGQGGDGKGRGQGRGGQSGGQGQGGGQGSGQGRGQGRGGQNGGQGQGEGQGSGQGRGQGRGGQG